MTKRILFLDIDGVIFSNPMDGSVHNVATKLFPGSDRPTNHMCDVAAVTLFNQTAIDNLNSILNSCPDVMIVLCTSWRTKGNVEFLKQLFSYHAYSERIIDKIQDKGNKSAGISKWLSDNPTDRYVILEDDDIFSEHAGHLVLTHPNKLLTQSDAVKAITMLNSNM